LTNTVVLRPIKLLEKDAYGEDTVFKHEMLIALAKCPVCKSRFRILPADILPYKHYSLDVMEHVTRLYNQGDLSLRKVVWDGFYGDHAPAHTTLHAWTEGLGAYWSGRCFGEVAWALPAATIMTELEVRYPQRRPLYSIPVLVDPDRYRSKERRERLEFCQQFEKICGMIACCFSGLNRLIVGWGHSFGFCFRSGIMNTRIEQIDFADVLPCGEQSNMEAKTCPIRGRSPPFDTK
jgi:hypothetical protein